MSVLKLADLRTGFILSAVMPPPKTVNSERAVGKGEGVWEERDGGEGRGRMT